MMTVRVQSVFDCPPEKVWGALQTSALHREVIWPMMRLRSLDPTGASERWIEGGHDAIHPQLGTFEDFQVLLSEARNLDLEIALDRRMRADDWLRAGTDVGGTQLTEQHTIDQQRVPVASAARRPYAAEAGRRLSHGRHPAGALQDLGVDVNRDCEGQTHSHSARVGFDGLIDKITDLGKLLDLRELAIHLFAGQSQDGAI